jgi:hypothetical protein
MFYKLTKVYTNDTLDIGMLNSIFPLQTKTQNWNLEYFMVDVILEIFFYFLFFLYLC